MSPLKFSPHVSQAIEQWLSRIEPKKTIAVFDWDNTVIENDIGEAVFWYLLENNLARFPKDWESVNPYLSQNAVRALGSISLTSDGCAKTAGNKNATELLLSLYHNDRLPEETKSAWVGEWNANLMRPSYAWLVQLFSGYSPNEVHTIVEDLMRKTFQASPKTFRLIGTKTVPNWIRFRPAMEHFIRMLQDKGVHVWISSASAQWIIEPIAAKLSLSNVIGARTLVENDKITPVFESCAGLPEGMQIMNYRQGKRAWLNKVVFNTESYEEPSKHHFAAGDSPGDEFLLKDAQALKLFMKHDTVPAFVDKKWLVEEC